MAAQRKPSEDGGSPNYLSPGVIAETLRLVHAPAMLEKAGDEKISVFWRVFGGTILSIAALAVVTAYQQFTSTLGELRAAQARLNEANASAATKEDLNTRTTPMWASIKDTGAKLPLLEARAGQLEGQLKAAEQDRSRLQDRVEQLAERVARLEGRDAAPGATSQKGPSR